MGGETSMVAINQVPMTALVTSTGTSTGSGADGYFQTVVVTALLRMLKDPASSVDHRAVIEAIMLIFKSQGLKCVGSLPQVRGACRGWGRIWC
jgi:FKBP12-rapamycin complex-associated protein